MAQGCRYDDDVLPGSLSVPAKGESWAIDIGALKWARGGVRFLTLCAFLPHRVLA
jgi:hypothetical protein